MSWCVWAAITKLPKLGGLLTMNIFFSHNSGSWEVQHQGTVDLVFGESSSQMLLEYPYVVERAPTLSQGHLPHS